MTLTFKKKAFDAAWMGKANVIPSIQPFYKEKEDPKVTVADGFRKEEGEWVYRGAIHTILPYTVLDQYDRNIEKRDMDVAILENEYLRATFMLDLGGRLWSLYSKTENRELLYENPVYQPANLALRNAWFSGGVEWNIGIIGHHPYTCSPMFAAESRNEKGEPVLVMYEYERKRGVAYSVKATLARDVLLIHVDIQNRMDTPTWMYWWSNIAVDETDGSRVLVPARQSYTFNRREDGVTVVGAEDTPFIDGWDSSYPATHTRARDFFYRIDPAQPKWEANVDRDGRGMVQFSTPELVGRKLFVWGAASQGGKNWNRWLSHGDTRYTEIQAGLLRSQMEQCQMPPHSAYHWTEGYTACSGDPTILHGADYDAANRLVEDSLRDKYPLLTDGYFNLVGEAKLRHFGSGWGALEEELRGQRLSDDPTVVFPATSVREEGDIAMLLATGHLPAHDPEDYSISYVSGEGYIHLLEESGDRDWYTMLLLGCAYYEAERYEEAKAAYRASVEATENFIACRCLAWMCVADDNKEEGRAWMRRSEKLGRKYPRSLIDVVKYFKRYGTDEEVCEIIENATDEARAQGRIRMYYADSLTQLGRLDEAREIVTENLIVPDMQEGENTTFKLWCDLYARIIARDENRPLDEIKTKEVLEKYPIPAGIDFRMGEYEVH